MVLTDFKYKQFPMGWEWLLNEPGPKILLEALSHYGIMEHKGKGSFVNFDKWAKELHVQSVMSDDDVPWCGLFMGICAKRAGWSEYIPDACYRAINWLHFGNKLDEPELGCVMVYKRPGGNHTNLYVGETETHYAGIGGNQSNMVNITLIEKERALGYRECPWRYSKPTNIRSKIYVNKDGLLISKNEV